MKYFLPINLDIEKLIRENPPHGIKGFKKANLLYILDLIITIPASRKDLVIVNDFIRINSVFLQKKIRNYRTYLDYLIENKVIQTDNRYLKGTKSKGYKFSPVYMGNIKLVQIEGKSLFERGKILSPSVKNKYWHLLKWYDGKLQIDKHLAIEYISADKERKLTDPALVAYDKRDESYGKPFRQHNCAMIAIEKISAGSFSPFIDTNVFRLHSSITNLRSELRNCLSYNCLQLVSIDIANCQPYLSTLLLNAKFWERSSADSLQARSFSKVKELSSPDCALLCVDDVAPKMCDRIFYSNSILSSFIMLCKSAETHNQSELQEYINLVKNGEFYQCLQNLFNEQGYSLNERKQIKAAVFQVLFTDNRYFGQKGALPKRIFQKAFPTIYKVLARIKRGNKKNLPVLLQRIESYLVLLVVCKRITQERPNLPIFTIHDSIITTVDNEEYVKRIIVEEMERAIGFPPKLTIDYWQPENLKFSDGESFFDSHSKIA